VSGERFRQYTSFVADIDLLQNGQPCCEILILADGNLALTPSSPISGDETITGLKVGHRLKVRATAIKASGTTTTSVLVIWP
jgi:hypothetical protein